MRRQVTVECATMNVEVYETITETRYRDMASWDVLVRIETPKLNRIERILTEMVDNHLPLISVTVASNPNYLLTITKWDDDEIHYSIEVENDTTGDRVDDKLTQAIGDLLEEQTFATAEELPLEGCPTDEEIQIASWAEGRGYGDSPKEGL